MEKRPGGLTALAVINFVFGAFSLLGALGSLLLFPQLASFAERAAAQDMPPEQVARLQALSETGSGFIIGMALLSLVTAMLLILSGVGYLKLKQFLGRTLGNTYAFMAIASSLASVFLFPVSVGGGFNIMVMAGLIYPAVTLVLLNTTFKEDFVH